MEHIVKRRRGCLILLAAALMMLCAAPAGAKKIDTDPAAWKFFDLPLPADMFHKFAVTKAGVITPTERILLGGKRGLYLSSPVGTSPMTWDIPIWDVKVRSIATGHGVIVVVVQDGSRQHVYHSLDETTWTRVHSMLPHQTLRDAAFISPHDGSIYLSVKTEITTAAGWEGDKNYGVLVSRDSGRTWNFINFGFDGAWFKNRFISWSMVQQPAATSGKLFLCGELNIPPSPYVAPLLMSKDNGLTWQNLGSPGSGWHCGSLALAPDGKRLYFQAEGGATHWSDDGGGSWSTTGTCLMRLITDPASRCLIGGKHLASWDPGIFVTCDPSPPSWTAFTRVDTLDNPVLTVNTAHDRLYAWSVSKQILRFSPIPRH